MTDTVSASMKIAGAKAAEAFGVILSFEQTAAIYAAMLAASPQGEGSSADASPAVTEVGKLIQSPLVEKLVGALKRLATATERLMAAWPDTHVPGRKLCVEVSEALNDAKALSHIPDAPNMIAHVEAVAWRDIATAPRQEPVLVGHSGFLGWRRLAICNALGEWSYCDRPWLQQDPLDETPTHWHPLPPPPSARPAPIKPSGDTGELRERMALEIRNWDFDISRIEGCLELADAILDLIQSEECETCYGSGKIFEAATTTGANQHSACQYDCEDCDGTGYNT